MNAYAEKIEIIQWITGLNDRSTLRQLMKIKEQSDIKLHDRVGSISERERESIERGIVDSENGNITPHAEVRKRYEKWL